MGGVTAFRIRREVGAGLPSGSRRTAREAHRLNRLIGAVLCGALALTSLPPAGAQTPGCSSGTPPEQSGPTDINAVTGNGGLTAAENEKGTLTVLKWPSPSYYDQLEYRTTDRSEPRMGADADHGAFLGLAWKRAGAKAKWHFSWLRSWWTQQRFADADGDEIVTTHRNSDAGLTVLVRDVVRAGEDVLVRSVKVTRAKRSPVRAVRLFSFANFNPVFSKAQGAPDRDWCNDTGTDEGAQYLKDVDAVVQGADGIDESTGRASGVSLAMAFNGSSDGHSIGSGSNRSAYSDAMDAKLANNASAGGPSDVVVFDGLSLKKRTSSTTVVIAAGKDRRGALAGLRSARRTSPERIRAAKRRWWKRWLDDAPLPKNAPAPVTRVAKRSLITVRQAIDARGLIATSVATQSPLGLDWVRNGAYINAMLHAARHGEVVEKHNRRYAALQYASAAMPTPRGNWPTSMYADGIPGSTTPYEIDSTGLGIWTLWEQYRRTKDVGYLTRVYEPIRRAADHLSSASACVDATTRLQCLAHEEDGATPTQTLIGAQAAWLGLGAAVSAAKEAMRLWGFTSAKRDAWSARRAELRAAIDTYLYDEDCECYTTNPSVGGTLLWPVRLLRRGSEASDRQAALNWRSIRRAMSGEVNSGGMEARALLGNAHAWAGRPAKIALAKDALAWLARTRTTNTGLLGGAWAKRNGRVVIMRSQPHAWHHAMFYLAALKAYGSERYSFR